MRFAAFRQGGRDGLAVEEKDGRRFRGLLAGDAGHPGSLSGLVEGGADALAAGARALLEGPEIDLASVELLPPLPAPGKIVCVGLNYAEHSAEGGFAVPEYPTVFGRFPSSLVGHGAPIVKPGVS